MREDEVMNEVGRSEEMKSEGVREWEDEGWGGEEVRRWRVRGWGSEEMKGEGVREWGDEGWGGEEVRRWRVRGWGSEKMKSEGVREWENEEWRSEGVRRWRVRKWRSEVWQGGGEERDKRGIRRVGVRKGGNRRNEKSDGMTRGGLGIKDVVRDEYVKGRGTGRIESWYTVIMVQL